MKKARDDFKVGDAYAIPDPDYGWYFAIVGKGKDFLFADRVSSTPIYGEASSTYFLRLMVNFPSIKRAKWKKIGNVPALGQIAEPGRYKYQSVGSAEAFIWLSGAKHEHPDYENEADKLETMAVWDAKYHILPLLRYHFFRIETPFIKQLKTVI